jgi:ketosteroid isomerase-like protein
VRDTDARVPDQDVQVVRRFFEVIERAFDAYWRDPRSIAGALTQDDLWPEWKEAFDHLHPDVEWQTVFLGQTLHGYREAAEAWDDYLNWARDYRPGLEDVEDLGEGRVFAVVTLAGAGKESGARMESRFFDVVTVTDGRIARIQEYTTRADAVEAAKA